MPSIFAPEEKLDKEKMGQCISRIEVDGKNLKIFVRSECSELKKLIEETIGRGGETEFLEE